MNKLKCIIFGHLNYYQIAGKYTLTHKCLKCNKPMYKDKKEQILRAIEFFQSKFGNNWLKHIKI